MTKTLEQLVNENGLYETIGSRLDIVSRIIDGANIPAHMQDELYTALDDLVALNKYAKKQQNRQQG